MPSGCCRSCLSSLKSSPCPALGLCVIPWAQVGPGGCWPLRAALGGLSEAHGGVPSRMPRPVSPRCSPLLLTTPSPTQTPSLSPGPLPGPQITAGSPPDGSAAAAQRASFAVTWQGPGEEEIHLYNKSANGFLAHERFIRYLSDILKVGLKQHGICQDASSQPEQRKNSQGESEMPLLIVHAAGLMARVHVRAHGSSPRMSILLWTMPGSGPCNLHALWAPGPASGIGKYAWLEVGRAGLSACEGAELARRTSCPMRSHPAKIKVTCPRMY